MVNSAKDRGKALVVGTREAELFLDPWAKFPLCGLEMKSFQFPETHLPLKEMSEKARDQRFPSLKLITRVPLFGEDHLAERFWNETPEVSSKVTVYRPRVISPESVESERRRAPTVHQVGQAVVLYFWKTGRFLFEDQYVVTSSYSKKWDRWALCCFRPDCGMYVTLHYEPPPEKLIALHAAP